MEYDANRAVTLALAGKPVEFESEVRVGLADKILDAIEAKRVEVASKIFGTPEYEAANAPVESEDDQSVEVDDA
jgi:hypothetical protein